MHILIGLACICIIFAFGAPLLRLALGIIFEILFSIFFLAIIIGLGLFFHWAPITIFSVFLLFEICIWAAFIFLKGQIAKEQAASVRPTLHPDIPANRDGGAKSQPASTSQPFIPATPSVASTAKAGTNFATAIGVPNSTDDDSIYDQISKELEGHGLVKRLWTKCFADADGDENKTRALYIKSRFAELENKGERNTPRDIPSKGFGEFFLEPQFLDAETFSEGFAAVKIGSDYDNSKYGFIDKAGKLVIESRFARARGFREGYAAVGIGSSGFGSDNKFDSNVKWGIINRQGEFEIYPQFEGIWYERDGVFNAQIKDSLGKIVNKLIDKHGNEVHPAFLNEYRGLARDNYDSFIDGLGAVYSPSGLVGYMNLAGEWVIEPKFQETHLFSEGLAAAKLPGETSQYGYIDKSGRWAIAPKFKDAFPFSDGLASVKVVDRGQERTGYIDASGAFVIPPQFEQGRNFERGLAICRPVGGKTGFIDKTGEFVVEPKFESVRHGGGNGLAPVLVGQGLSERWGYIFL